MMTTTPDNIATITYDHYAPGLTLERHHDKHIIVYRLSNSRPDTVDAWVNKIDRILATWPEHCPYFVVTDASNGHVLTSSYARKQIQTIFDKYGHIRGYVALIAPDTVLSKLFTIFLNSLRSRNVVQKMFLYESEGIAWLTAEINHYRKSGGTIHTV